MSNRPPTLKIRTISQSRTFPVKRCTTLQTVPLSILDATVANFAATAGVWIYDSAARDTSGHARAALNAHILKRALQETLNAYPHFAGGLEWTPYQPCDGYNDHTRRHGRLQVTYGSSSDPGVDFVEAYCDLSAKELVPSAKERASGLKVWNVSALPARELFPGTKMGPSIPVHEQKAPDEDQTSFASSGPPGMKVQITTFADSSVAVAVMFAHPLADAQVMAYFMHDWAAVNAAMAADAPLPLLSPVFDPGLLDGAADGDIDAPTFDEEIVGVAQTLPVHRYDWWSSIDGCPEGWDDAAKIPEEFVNSIGISHDPRDHSTPQDSKSQSLDQFKGQSMPWSQWDINAPVGNYLIHFTGKEIARMWKTALSTTPASKSLPSRHDAILAHMWALINRARAVTSFSIPSSTSLTKSIPSSAYEASENDLVHLDLTLGVRSRIHPKLSDRFVGSPIILAHFSLPAKEAITNPLGVVALGIRRTMAHFTPSAVAALLHEKAHQASAQRYWDAFCGRHHVIVTSWAHLNVYDVDFVGLGTRTVPRYVLPLMPDVDGCLQLMEAAPVSIENKDGMVIGGNLVRMKERMKQHWTENGVDVKLQLEAGALKRLLEDPLLRKYA